MTRRFLLAWVTLMCVTLGLLALPARAQQPAKERLTDSVERALAFLKSMQEQDGSWQMTGAPSTGVTSLVVMAFLSAGHLPGEGPYGTTVEKGIRFVLANQQPSGIFHKHAGMGDMYQHGISTLMIAEVMGMTDAELAKDLKPKLEKGVSIILQAQKTDANAHRGGWRYQVNSFDADLSVTGWQLLALRAAKNVGCDVPGERIDLAIDYVRRCRDSSTGGFCYTAFGRATVACTSTGILALELCGKEGHLSREAVQAGSFVLKQPLVWGGEHYFYTLYYSSQALFQLGNNYWSFYRPQLHKVLFDNQQANGSWVGLDVFGPAYSTSMAVLALTVEYRYLPIYQRDETAGEKK